MPGYPMRSLSGYISVVIPVYNEINYIIGVIEQFQKLSKEDFAIELIVVESNSTDGTRELISSWYEAFMATTNSKFFVVKIIFQDSPQGKGSAVRLGIANAGGSYIAIFDADNEYDPAELGMLVEPILSGKTKFVLGNRLHSTHKVRFFNDSTFKAWLFNIAQFLLTKAFNFVYATKIEDPFTMWKVFDVSCLNNIQLVSNRFDLDWEIVAKFSRRGIFPLELPISYNSRDFSQGKKVKMLKDGTLAIIALFKFRFGSF